MKHVSKAWQPLASRDNAHHKTLVCIDKCAELLHARHLASIPPNAPMNAASLTEHTTRLLSRLGQLAQTKRLLRSPIAKSKRFRTTWALFDAGAADHVEKICKPKSDCRGCSLISFCKTGLSNMPNRHERKPIIDLFSGAGALSAGFSREGFRPVLAVEKSRHAAQSYRHNHPGVPVLEIDARHLTPSQITKATGLSAGEFAAVIGGPPCQGYSAAGKRKPRIRQNLLFTVIADIGRQMKIPIVVMENVPGLDRVNGYDFTDRILSYFKSRGYTLTRNDVDASHFGVPQKRRRVIFVGSRSAIPANLAPPRKISNPPSVVAALKNLPRLRPGGGADVLLDGKVRIYNHQAMFHGKAVINKIRKIRPGTGPISYRRLPLELAQTIIAGHRAMPVHHRQHRTITVREAARLQSLPDSFRFLGPRGEQPIQVANAVPYKLARSVAKAVAKAS